MWLSVVRSLLVNKNFLLLKADKSSKSKKIRKSYKNDFFSAVTNAQ